MSDGAPRGTAFLTCDCRTYATAAHVLVDARVRMVGGDAYVHFNDDKGNPHLIDKTKMTFTAPSVQGAYELSEDWIVGQLDRPVPDCAPPQRKLTSTDERWAAVTLIGFHDDLHSKKITRECTVSHALHHKGLLIRMCDGEAGTSGSPLVVTETHGSKHEHRVVAIQIAEQRSFGFNVAALLSEEFGKAVRRHAASCEPAGSANFPDS